MESPPLSASSLQANVLTLLREMAGSLSQSKAAILSSDLAGLEFQTERQRELCRRWTTLSSLAQPLAGRNALPDDLSAAALEAGRRLRAYAALLRRAKRTVGIFCRVLATSEVTYAPPPGSTPAKP